MQEFQKRVVEEKAALNERFDKLTQFIEGPEFMKLPEAERLRLSTQRRIMNDYSRVLAERIDNFLFTRDEVYKIIPSEIRYAAHTLETAAEKHQVMRTAIDSTLNQRLATARACDDARAALFVEFANWAKSKGAKL